jgi:hypothetical protein
VQVLSEKPRDSFTVIARIESSSDALFDDFDDLRTKLLKEAARLGGDAVILREPKTESTFLITATGQIHSDRKILVGEVIVFSGWKSLGA